MKSRPLFVVQLFLFVMFVNGSLASENNISENGLRFIKTNKSNRGQWVDEEGILQLLRMGIKFMDLTNINIPLPPKGGLNEESIPEKIRFKATVKEAISKIQVDRIEGFLTEFSEFNNRYYKSKEGAEAAEWLFAQVQRSIAEIPYSGNVNVIYFVHHEALTSPQKSVIARIEGSGDLAAEVVILGAHLDSINNGEDLDPTTALAPGADDNASGCVVLLETFRVLLGSGFIPERSIEFQWYAAEEVGLRGSIDIASTYAVGEIKVVGMINFDVVGFGTWIESIGLHIDYTSVKLNQFIRTLVWEYLDFTTTDLLCEYACSDHVSFHQSWFPAAFPSEPINTKHMHTENDTLSTINMTFVHEFTKLGIAVAIELSELDSTSGGHVVQLGFLTVAVSLVLSICYS